MNEEKHDREIETLHKRIDALAKKVDDGMKEVTESIHSLTLEFKIFSAELRKAGEPGKSIACEGHQQQLEDFKKRQEEGEDTARKLDSRVSSIEKSRIHSAGFVAGVAATCSVIVTFLTIGLTILARKLMGV